MSSQASELNVNKHIFVEKFPGGPTNGESSGQDKKKSMIKTRFIIALLLFFIFDLVIRFQFHPDPYNLPEHTFIWWAVKDYRELKQAPEIMFLGSSLMLAVVDEGDATRYQKLIDSSLHHHSMYMEELLAHRFGRQISTFCFAIGGQMVSDAYAIATNFINAQFKPRVIIWGIAPRDIVDACFPGAASSDTAEYMNKIAGKQIVSNSRLSFNEAVSQFLSVILSIYRSRQDIVSLLKQEFSDLRQHNKIPFLNSYDEKNPPSIERATMLRQLGKLRDGSMGDIAVGEWMINYTTKPSTELKDNKHEYDIRYHPFKRWTFEAQTSYLQKFLEQQKNLGVKVILVNMPLTKQNMALLPVSSYNMYFSTLNNLATKYGATVIDLNNDPRFVQGDFYDTAHLNGIGCEKWLQLISDRKEIDFLHTPPITKNQ